MSESASRNSVEDVPGTGGTRPGEAPDQTLRGLVAHAAGPLPDGALAGVLRSGQNAVAALAPGVFVEVVIQGPGVSRLAQGSESEGDVSIAVASGIRVLACGNSLRSAGVPAEGLLPGVEVVPAAIAHLAERQWNGWAYIRL
ncbi:MULTISPECIES: DsrE family protein [unclassified Arthrobacter]|uniref:DsrE family protein n=1 Tax=unclassified Arthrobacter TaxID=235627 RepID=UPI002DFA64E5|nr:MULTISPECIES: hypothetical protein [unclassified Arthrobacter]MEC5193367.1 intracellular sulfur oxidation DsrE/DsrF family protein [Arthrobacter sp. MP_M4]MEC5204833.1 intracellular sulfur oxidation DsrE/DsrF family protein [Arthrobacter sp. MP_M7]